MTSPATHDETIAFFEENKYFGLPSIQVTFFCQGTMPTLDRETGRLLLEKPGSLFLSPNGHGGTLISLADSGLLTDLKARGIRYVFYFQVDNPLVFIAQPGFLGLHIERQSEASSKVVYKEKPEEKVGILALTNGRCGIVEYSDMPPILAERRLPDGTLRYRAGNPAIHLFSMPFLERVTSGADRLAFHIAKKKVSHYDPTTKQYVQPITENALKFELFIFDALPRADRWLAVSTKREEEFAPLKNARGADSPEAVRNAIIARSQRWLRNAGATISNDVPVEIRPSFALEAGDCRDQARMPKLIEKSTVLE
jgi:UDP-N-acetylglucosamine/UDP-N-acetylgalactosamine diphosphorylase